MKNKFKKIIWPTIILVCCATICGLVYVVNTHEAEPEPVVVEKFNIEHELYEGSKLNEITSGEFEKLIEDQKSFVVIAHMEFCPAETPLTTTAEQLANDDGYTFYALKADEFKQTSLASEVTYLPSAAIYHDGKLVKYLDAESDEDIPYYQSAEGLRNWLNKYINLKEES